jgi:hypothetical protein
MSLILSGTDGLSDVDGSAATPAIRGTDANTGIFFPAADTIAFAEGGAECARFDSSGNFGLGVTPNTTSLGGTYSLLAVGKASGSGIIMGQTDLTAADSTAAQFLGKTTGASGYQLLGGMLVQTDGSSTTNAVGRLIFYTATGGSLSERARFNSTGAFVLAGGTTTANGIGITFPVTQSASSNANTLDDYEEGTWTPVDGSGAGLSFSVIDARYTKIGRMVQCFAQIVYPSTANTSSAAISGLPFTMATTTGGAYGAFTVYTTEPTAVTWLNLSNTTTSNAYTVGGASVTNATFSTDQYRLVWIYETA